MRSAYGRVVCETLLRPKQRFDLIDELSAQLVSDPPRQPAVARLARRKNDGKFRRDFRIFGDNLDAAIRYIRDHAVTRQSTGSELDLRKVSA